MTNSEYLNQLERIDFLMKITKRAEELSNSVDNAFNEFIRATDTTIDSAEAIHRILQYTLEVSYYNGVTEGIGIDNTDPIILSGIMLSDGDEGITDHINIMIEILKSSIKTI